jgi:hypothetical protein
MSCLSNNYSGPNPTRDWSRFSGLCLNIPTTELSSIVIDGFAFDLAVFKKGYVLKHTNNLVNFTKNQKYYKIATGKWVGKKGWASQTQSYTNPNVNDQKVNNATNVDISGRNSASTNLPVTCNANPSLATNNSLPPSIGGQNTNSQSPVIPPPPPVTPSGNQNGFVIPKIVPDKTKTPKVISNGGTLSCNIKENVCTGEIIKNKHTLICVPTSSSDVPGPIEYLCYSNNFPSLYPPTRYVYLAGSSKWPEGYKFTGQNKPLKTQPSVPQINNIIINN